MRIPGGDINHWSYDRGDTTGNKIDQLADNGVEFLWAKVNQGSSFDAAWTFHKNALLRNNTKLVPGAFIFGIKGDGEAQVDRFLSGIGDPNGWLCGLDVEGAVGGGQTIDIDTINVICETFQANVPNHPFWIYTGRYFWAGNPVNQYGKKTHYLGNPPLPDGVLLWSTPNQGYYKPRRDLYMETGPTAWKPEEFDFAVNYGGRKNADMLQFGSLGVTGAKHGGLKIGDGDCFPGEQTALRTLAGTVTSGNPGTCPAGYHMDSSGTCVPDVAGCPTGYTLNPMGVCVPDNGNGGGTDEPWDGSNDQASTTAYTAGVGVGTGGGLILAAAAAAVLAVVYVGYRSGSKHEPVVDRGEEV